MADNQMRLHGLAGSDSPTLENAAIDKIGLTLIQNNVRRAHAVAIRVQRHRRVILRGHDRHADIFEEIDVRLILADGADVIRPVIHCGEHAHGTAKYRPRRNRPARMRNNERLRRGDAIPGIP